MHKHRTIKLYGSEEEGERKQVHLGNHLNSSATLQAVFLSSPATRQMLSLKPWDNHELCDRNVKHI